MRQLMMIHTLDTIPDKPVPEGFFIRNWKPGEEEIWVGPPDSMSVAIPFDEAKDVSWHRHEGDAGLHRVVMRPGDFLVLWPGAEAHQPATAPAGALPGAPIRKAIAKVAL